jgi:hypothetical protein
MGNGLRTKWRAVGYLLWPAVLAAAACGKGGGT